MRKVIDERMVRSLLKVSYQKRGKNQSINSLIIDKIITKLFFSCLIIFCVFFFNEKLSYANKKLGRNNYLNNLRLRIEI